MSIAYYVQWQERFPTWEVIEAEVREYLGIAHRSIEWTDNVLMVILPGESTWQTLRDPQTGKTVEGYAFPPARATRFFEVWCHEDDHCTITIREADEFTNVVAEGFAKRIARKFSGVLEDE